MPKKSPFRNQKILVPKGAIDPSDDTIIEIPANLFNQPIVIAKKTGCGKSFTSLYDDSKPCQSSCGGGVSYKSALDVPQILMQPPIENPALGRTDLFHRSTSSQSPDLDKTEYAEKETLLRELEDFQKARRKLLHDTKAVASGTNIGNSVGNVTFTVPPRTPEMLLNPKIKQGSLDGTKMNFNKKLSDHKFPRSCKSVGVVKLPTVDSESDSEDEDIFAPLMSSSILDVACNSCCKPYGCKRCGNKSKPRKTKITMDNTPSQCSKVSETASGAESHPSACGIRNHDSPCSICCNTKSSQKLNKNRSRCLMTDTDFDRIKQQLREARRKLDEAVAMVSKTVPSSSCSSTFTSGKVSPERAYSPISSPTVSKRQPEVPPDVRTAKSHDHQKCPLQDLYPTSESLKASKSRSTVDPLLCLDSCSNTQIPPCTVNDVKKPKQEEPKTYPLNAVKPRSSTIPCTRLFPCDIPSSTSGQNLIRPPVRSMPASSTRMDKNQSNANDRLNQNIRFSPHREDDAIKYSRSKDKNKPNRPDIACSSNQSNNALCSTVCLNMDPPPCITQDFLKKKAEELENAIRRLAMTTNSNTVPCTPMFPCDIPSATSKQEIPRPPPTSTRSSPISSTNLQEITTRNKTEETDYSKFRDNVNKKSTSICKASQTKSSNVDDKSCVSVCTNLTPPPCESDVGLNKNINPKVPETRKLSPRPSANQKVNVIPCKPMFPCDMPSSTARQDSGNLPPQIITQSPPHTTVDSETEVSENDDKHLQVTKDDPKAKRRFSLTKERKNSKDDNKTPNKKSKKPGVGRILTNTTTQTTETTVTLFKDDFEDDDTLEAYLNNPSSTNKEIEDKITKTTIVKFDKKK